MTSIDFYFNADDRLQVACRLALNAMKRGLGLLIYAPDAGIAGRIDKALWNFVGKDQTPAHCDVLLNLAADCPPHFERFARLVEVVSAAEEDKRSGRSRYRFYLERGYRIVNHDLARS
jgi:DNA polymerase III subunit chi